MSSTKNITSYIPNLDISIATKISNLQLPCCIYNASGVNCVTESDLRELALSSSALVLSKSCTLEYRQGNPLPRYFEPKDQTFTTNSSGLPNLGYFEYGKLSESISTYKPFFTSVSGLSVEDNLTIIRHFSDMDTIKGIELNLSCPNIVGKPQIGYDFPAMEELIRKVTEITGPYQRSNVVGSKLLGLKMPPYFDISHFNMASEVINQFKIDFITCINSIGNGLIVDPIKEQVVIKPKNGYGGIGGSVIKATSLANVHQFYKLTNCDIVGCGGVRNGTDVFEHILCGASAVQVGSQLKMEGLNCFNRLTVELQHIMEQKGYQTLEDFKGKLKYI